MEDERDTISGSAGAWLADTFPRTRRRVRTASLALGLVLLPTAGFADPVGTVAYTFHVHSAAMLRGSYGRAVLQIGGYRNNAAGATLRWSRENRFAPP